MKLPFPSLTETWHNKSYDAISPTQHALSVAGKTVIVTGGGRGIGPEIAKAFAAAGASHVVLIGRTQATLSQTAEAIEKEFPSVSVSTHAGDIADEDAMEKAAAAVKKWDVLILNAGVLATDPQPVARSKVEDWWGIFETNVKGAMVTTKAFLPFRNSGASVVGVNANLITLPVDSLYTQGTSAYNCSKVAQMKMLEFVSAENPDVFVVSVHPGVFLTDMVKDSSFKIDPAIVDDMSLPAHFLVWVVSQEARFLKGKFVCANWDVPELKAKAKTIEKERILETGVLGWPYGEAMDAMLAQGGSEK